MKSSNRRKRAAAIATALLLPAFASTSLAQWRRLESNITADLRGLCAVNAQIAWASGTHGSFTHTTDGGASWVSGVVPGAAELDFRDVEAFDADTAYLLSAGKGPLSRIYKTTDGGVHWTQQFVASQPDAFFDAMAFWDRDHGIALSDPVDGHFLIIVTDNGGRNWNPVPAAQMPPAVAGEGAFAASGTCIAAQGASRAWFVTGGSAARVFRSDDRGKNWSVTAAPIN